MHNLVSGSDVPRTILSAAQHGCAVLRRLLARRQTSKMTCSVGGQDIYELVFQRAGVHNISGWLGVLLLILCMFMAAVWELYTGERLFDEHISVGQVYYMIAYEGWRPPIPEGCHPGYTQLMTACWAHDPEQRPRASEVHGKLQDLYMAERQLFVQGQSSQ
jgi:hypothetical protein